MKTKLASILLGLALAAGTGTVVYVKKNTSALPVPTAAQSTVNAPSASQAVQTSSRVRREYGDDGDDDDGGYVTTQTPTQIPMPTTSSMGMMQTGITLATVAQHNSRSSCWSAINGSVYDLTSWIPNHPGGEQAILSICGIDGSAAFNNQHGGQSRPTAILAGFKIGVLQ